MISDKTKVSINIATLLFVIGSTATMVFSLSEIKGRYDLRLNDLVRSDMEINRRMELIESEQEANRAMLLQTQTDLAEIKTDLKWIRSALED